MAKHNSTIEFLAKDRATPVVAKLAGSLRGLSRDLEKTRASLAPSPFTELSKSLDVATDLQQLRTATSSLDKSLGALGLSLTNTSEKVRKSSSVIQGLSHVTSKSLATIGRLNQITQEFNRTLEAFNRNNLNSIGASLRELESKELGAINRAMKSMSKVRLTQISKDLDRSSRSMGSFNPVSIDSASKSLKVLGSIKLEAVSKEIKLIAKSAKDLNPVSIQKFNQELKSLSTIDLSRTSKSLSEVGKASKGLNSRAKGIEAFSKSLSVLKPLTVSLKSTSSALESLSNVKSLKSKAKGLDEFNKALAGLKPLTVNLTSTTEALSALSKIKSLRTVAKSIEFLSKTLDELKGEYAGVEALAQALDKLSIKALKVKELAESVELLVRSTARMPNISNQVRSSLASLNGLGGAARGANGGIGTLGVGLGAAGIATGVMGFAALKLAQQFGELLLSVSRLTTELAGGVVQSAIDVESAFAGVLKTTDGLGVGIESLTAEGQALFQELRNVSTTKPFTFEDVAIAMELGGQLGITKGNLAEFAVFANNLDISTNLGLEEGTKALAQFMSVMGMSQTEMNNLGSAIVAMGNNYSTTEADIVSMMIRLASMSATVGMSGQAVTAFSTVLTSAGITAEAGGTSFNKIMGDINGAVADGGKKLAEFAKISGMSAEEFAAQWEADPSVAMLAFVRGLKEQGDNARNIIQDLFGKSSQMELVINTLIQKEGDLAGALQMSNEEWKKATALQKEADARYNTTASKVAVLSNQVRDLGLTFGMELLPIVGMVIDEFQPLIAVLAAHAPEAARRMGEYLQAYVVPGARFAAQGAIDALPAFSAFVEGLMTMGHQAVVMGTQALVWGANIGVQFANGLIDSLQYVVDAINEIANLMAYWLEPHSPPNAMPFIDKWGEGAAEVYLDSFGKTFKDNELVGVKAFATNLETTLNEDVTTDGGELSSQYLNGFFSAFESADFEKLNQFSSQAKIALSSSFEGDELEAKVVELTMVFSQAIVESKVLGVVNNDTLQSITTLSDSTLLGDLASEYLSSSVAAKATNSQTKELVATLNALSLESVNAMASDIKDFLSLDGDHATIAVSNIAEAYAIAAKEMASTGQVAQSSLDAISAAAGAAGVEVGKVAKIKLELLGIESAEQELANYRDSYESLSTVSMRASDDIKGTIDSFKDITPVNDFLSAAEAALMIDGDDATESVGMLATAFMDATKEAEATGAVSSAALDKIRVAAGETGGEVARIAELHIELALLTREAASIQEQLSAESSTALSEQAHVLSEINQVTRDWGEDSYKLLDEITRGIGEFTDAGGQAAIDLQKALVGAVNDIENLGHISTTSLGEVESALSSVKPEVRSLARQYFDLAKANSDLARVQDELTRATKAQNEALSPIDDAIDELDAKQRILEAEERLGKLREELAEGGLTDRQHAIKELAIQKQQLEIERFQIELQTNEAVEAAEVKLEQAENVVTAKESEIDATKESLKLSDDILSHGQDIIDQRKEELLLAQDINKARQDAIKNEVTEINEKLVLEQTIQEGKRATVQIALDGIDKEIEALGERKGELNKELDALKAKATLEDTIQAKVKAEASIRTKALEDRLKLNRDLLGEAKKGTNEASKTKKETTATSKALAEAKAKAKEMEEALKEAKGEASHTKEETTATSKALAEAKAKAKEMEETLKEAKGEAAGVKDEMEQASRIDIIGFNPTKRERSFGRLDNVGFNGEIDLGPFNALQRTIEGLTDKMSGLGKEFSTSMSDISESLTKLSAKADELFSTYESSMPDWGSYIPSIESLGNGFEYTKKAAGDFFNGMMTSGSAFMASPTYQLLAGEGWTYDGSIAQKFIDYLTPIGTDLSKSIQDGWKMSWEEAGEWAGQLVIDTLAPGHDVIDAVLTDSSATFSESIQNIFPAVVESSWKIVGGTFYDAIYAGFYESDSGTLRQALGEIFTELDLSITDSFVSIEASMKAGVDSWLPTMDPLADLFEINVPLSLAEMKSSFDTHYLAIQENMSGAVGSWLPTMDPLADLFEINVPLSLAEMKSSFDTHYLAIQENMSGAVDSWLPTFDPMKALFDVDMPLSLTMLGEKFTSGFTDIEKMITDKIATIKKDGDEIIKMFNKAVPDAIKAMSGFFAKEFPIFTKIATDSLKWIGEAADESRKFIKRLEKKFRALYDWITSINIPNPFAGWTEAGSQGDYDAGSSGQSNSMTISDSSQLTSGSASLSASSRVLDDDYSPSTGLIAYTPTTSTSNNVSSSITEDKRNITINNHITLQVESNLDVQAVADQLIDIINDGIYAT